MKALHLSDVHFCREHADDVFKSLKTVEDYAKNNHVDLIAIAGDLFDSAVLNSENARLTEFIEAIKRLGDLAPVAMVYGTPSHDVDGSLEIFKTTTCKYGITILDPGQPYFLTEVNGKGKIVQEIPGVSGKALILGIPEPRKKYLLADTSAGKDETEEAIRNAMHKMCYLLAAKRREYADIPCFVLYHGEVAGTVYQNDQTIERGTGIAITIDELADIGADYFALGHIHKPQKIGNINAYYAGSIYPKNFGETHHAGFKVVDVEASIENERLTSVNTIDFPHPQNMKIETDFDLYQDKMINAKPQVFIGFGKKVWLEITCTKEQRAMIDTEKELEKIIRLGAVRGSRVTVSETAVETVRAAEITEVNTPAKKFEVWAKNSNVEITDSHLKKIETLNTEIANTSIKAEGAWELVALRLKGSTGIMRGIKKEEVIVNFADFDNGLIALSGANGKGKTTLIENCHPYPQLFTRKGKLQDHFSLKDSFREIIYRNHVDGSMWKFLIQIDGQNKSGSCKYFIFKQVGESWEPLPGVDGNLKPYEESLASIFGPMELYLRTAFITQRATKNLPDITDATAGEKKTLFIALAGIDYLQNFADAASEKAKLEVAKTHDAEIKMQVLQSALDKKTQEKQSLEYSELALKGYNEKLTEITKQGKAAKADVERLQAAWNAEQVRQQQEREAEAGIDTIYWEIKNLDNERYNQTIFADSKPQYEKDIAKYESLQNFIDTENAKKQEVTEANLKKQQEYSKQKSAYDESLKILEVERDNLVDHRNSIERLISDAENNIRLAEKDEEVERNRLCKPLTDRKAEIDRLILTTKKNIELYERDAAEITDDCPTCGQKLPEDKLAELKAKRDEFVQKINAEEEILFDLNVEIPVNAKLIEEAILYATTQRNDKIAKENAEIKKHTDKISEINRRIDELAEQISEIAFDEPVAPNQEIFDDTELKAALEKQQNLNITEIRAALAQAQEAAVRIEGLQKQIDDKQKLLKEKDSEFQKIRKDPKYSIEIANSFRAAEKLHAELSEKYTETKTELARTEAGIEATKKTLAEIAEKETEYATLKNECQTSTVEALEWELIAKAFGKDGIQALELDALAPGISETANRILESAYGDRFQISIETTRIGGAGKKTKQIEDFLIYVSDMEDGEKRLLDNLSGGESVWVKRAIYDAFALIRKRNTGFSFLTAFQDEVDGALDAESKLAYSRMLEAVHAEGKMQHTIIITHSDAVKAAIHQQINMETQWAS